MNISESRIRELHTEIMYEDNQGEKEKIGKWKTQPNHVINYREEKFDFADPSEVADSMHELVNRVNAEKDKIDGLMILSMMFLSVILMNCRGRWRRLGNMIGYFTNH